MSKRVAVRHTIEHTFDKAVRLSTHWLRVRPAPQARTKVTAYSLSLDAGEHFLNWVRDPYQNYLARLDIADALGSMRIDIEYLAELDPVNPFDFVLEPEAVQHPFEYPKQLLKELAPFLEVDAQGPRMKAFLADLDGEDEVSTVERISTINAHVNKVVAAGPDSGWRAADLEDVLERRQGSSWDLAWLLCQALRHHGLAARFACGHQLLLVDDAEAADRAALHCWSEVYLPGAGWIGLDPSGGLFTDETYIPFAYAPVPLRVAPVVGFREACEERTTQRITVRRLVPEQSLNVGDATHRHDVMAVGDIVQRDLEAQGLAPALSGGINLVSALDGVSWEWHFSALGKGKRMLADALLETMQRKLAPGGVMQLGQGEWMQGDNAPRWKLGLYYRTDGEPICEGPRWLRTSAAGAPVSLDDVQFFAEALARALGADAADVTPAYEDPLGDMVRRSVNIMPPSAEDLRDPERRKALAERLSQSVGSPTGYALAVRRDTLSGRWTSGRWTLRRGELFLAPGSYPMGYRLPLGSLEHAPEAAREAQLERSPMDDCEPLDDFRAESRARLGENRASVVPSEPSQSAPRTALCVQAREGSLFVFLPPTTDIAHYLELVAAVEAAAERTGMPVCLEGYAPPEDARLRRFELEPDAGVLRVHLPQTDDWRARADLIDTVYAESWRVGLSPQRVTEDGRPLPTGGGVRTTVGGVTPAESPFLRRPGVLRGLIAYFQRHPSLSYFFAGRSIGSSGTGPRPDEGRDEALYELSLALEHLNDSSQKGCLWHADRVLSHLLTDPAGDPKRAEVRVDELYHPGRASLRQGRIHIGSFETAPDAHTAKLQSLLLLGLIGSFGKRPQGGELVRWQQDLQDRWLLPDFLWEDLREVVSDLKAAGYPFQLDWFEPLRNLRFPVLGSVLIGEVSLSLRTALEPQPLLAEQASGAGMARFIDVANERLQVRLEGMAPDRYILQCNGKRVPLHRTATHGEYLAGVRYKVTNPPATMHPTLWPIDSLVFDLIDTWSGKAIGGCTYIPPRFDYSFGPYGPVDGPVGEGGIPKGPPDESLAHLYQGAALRTMPQRFMNRYGGFFPWGSGLGPMQPPAPREEATARFPTLLDLVLGK